MVLRQQRLQKYSRILSNRYRIKLELNDSTELGCCNTANRIWINPDIDNDEIINLILQKSITLHELGHILFTSAKEWEGIDHNLANIISDGRVEEGVSRLFSKARMYFIYCNRKLLGKFERQEQDDIEKYTMELIFRESKRTTGIPPLSEDIHQLLKEKLGDDYQWFLKKTREAVEAKTEKESAEISGDIEDKFKLLFNKPMFDSLPNVGSVSSESSVHSSGSTARQLPKQTEEGKQLVEELNKLNKKESEQNTNDKSDADGEVETNEPFGDMGEDSGTSLGGNEQTDDAGESGGSGSGNESGDEPSDDVFNSMEENIRNEVMRELRNESDVISAGNVEGDFSTYDVGEGTPSHRRGYGNFVNPINTTSLESIGNRMAHTFKIIAQSGKNWNHNQTRGKLEMHKLTSLLQSGEQPRIFKRKIQKEKTDLAVAILLDASGSMQRRCKQATKAAYVIARALETGKYLSEIVQFGVRGYSYNKHVYGVKSFNQHLVYAKNKFVPLAVAGTPLLPALIGAEKSLMNQESKRKVVIVITDGAPDRMKSCKVKMNEMEKKGISVIGIVIDYSYRNLFPENREIVCNNVADLPVQMQGVIKNILLKSKRGG